MSDKNEKQAPPASTGERGGDAPMYLVPLGAIVVADRLGLSRCRLCGALGRNGNVSHGGRYANDPTCPAGTQTPIFLASRQQAAPASPPATPASGERSPRAGTADTLLAVAVALIEQGVFEDRTGEGDADLVCSICGGKDGHHRPPDRKRPDEPCAVQMAIRALAASPPPRSPGTTASEGGES